MINGGAILLGPRPPLLSVNWSQVAVFIGPFVPNRDLVFLEISNVGIAFEKPEKLVNDGAQVELFGGEAGEAFPEIVTGLPTKDAQRPGAGAVTSFLAVFENVGEEIEVSLHGGFLVVEGDDATPFALVVGPGAPSIDFFLTMLALLLHIAGAGADSLAAIPPARLFAGLFAGHALFGLPLFETLAEFLAG